MDIQLQSSTYLLGLRMTLVVLAVTATLASQINVVMTALVCAGVILQCCIFIAGGDPVSRLQFTDEADPSEKEYQQKVLVELRSSRRLELSLTRFYCTSWLQILYLHSSRGSRVVVILPDNCSANERRLLRMRLNQPGDNTVSTATGNRPG